jgi:hypothetical protein
MTYTVDRPEWMVSSAPLAEVPQAVATFESLTVEDRLATVWRLIALVGRAITPPTSGTARFSLIEGLLNQCTQLSDAEQIQVLFQLITRQSTPINRAYGLLSSNTQLSFWALLAASLGKSSQQAIAEDRLSPAASALLDQIHCLDHGQRIAVLRQVVANMGVDPFAAVVLS